MPVPNASFDLQRLLLAPLQRFSISLRPFWNQLWRSPPRMYPARKGHCWMPSAESTGQRVGKGSLVLSEILSVQKRWRHQKSIWQLTANPSPIHWGWWAMWGGELGRRGTWNEKGNRWQDLTWRPVPYRETALLRQGWRQPLWALN